MEAHEYPSQSSPLSLALYIRGKVEAFELDSNVPAPATNGDTRITDKHVHSSLISLRRAIGLFVAAVVMDRCGLVS